jgi:hypothetical protein
MQDIRKQFSLDWLSGSERNRPEPSISEAQAALNEAVIFYGQPIISQLERAPEGQMGLHDLARALKDDVRDFRFERLWEVIKHLADISMVEIADASDPAGNYLIRLGRKAKAS